MANAQTERIVDAAAQLFSARGFAAVPMVDIAERMDLTPGNLYRYVSGKSALLHEAFDAAIDLCETPVGESSAPDSFLEQAVGAAIAEPALIACWIRERGRMDAEAFPEITLRDRALLQSWKKAIGEAEPDGDSRSKLRRQAILGVMDAITQFRGEVNQHTREVIVAGLGAVITAPLPRSVGEVSGHTPRWRPPATRRQELIVAAVALFSERGFDDVRVTDIGQAIGISGPSVYEYFRTKQHILVAVFDRCAALLVSSASEALEEAAGPQDALRLLTHGLAHVCVVNRQVMAMGAREISSLGDADRERLDRLRIDLDDTWAAVIRECWPEMSAPTARVIAGAATQMTLHTTRLSESEVTAEEVAALTHAFIEAATTPCLGGENDC